MFRETEWQGVVWGTINRTLWDLKKEGNPTSHPKTSCELLEILTCRSPRGPWASSVLLPRSHTCHSDHFPLCVSKATRANFCRWLVSLFRTAATVYSWEKPHTWIFSLKLEKAREDWEKTYKLRILPKKGNKVWSRYTHWEDIKSLKISSKAEVISKNTRRRFSFQWETRMNIREYKKTKKVWSH